MRLHTDGETVRSYVLLVAVACSGGRTDHTDKPAEPVESSLTATATASEWIEAVFLISWTTEKEASHFVEFGLDDSLDRLTPTETGTAPSIPLLGMKAGRTYSWRAVSLTAVGVRLESSVETLQVPDVPADYPSPTLVFSTDESQVAEGYMLVSVAPALAGTDTQAMVTLIDGDGDYVWWRVLEKGHFAVSPSFSAHSNTVLLDDYYEQPSGEAGSGIWQLSLDGSSGIYTETVLGHHAVIEPEPGVLAWIAGDVRPNPGIPQWTFTDRVYEGTPENATNPVELINLFDDYFEGQYTAPCIHALGLFDIPPYEQVMEWTHSNSLVFLPGDESYIVHMRWTDTVVKIDRATGAILWEMGGPNSTFTQANGDALYGGAESSVLFSHAHLSQFWDGGFVVFDNADHNGKISGFLEYAYDEQTLTVSPVFEFRDPLGRFTSVLGDARKMPGGNYISAWTRSGEILEVDPTGEPVWGIDVDPMQVSRIDWAPDLYGVGQ